MDRLLREVVKITGDIWRKGWAERNAGNISIRLNGTEELDCLDEPGEWVLLPVPKENLANERFIVSGAGFYLRNIELDPEAYMCLLELNGEGSAYRMVWGFRDGGRPTSEFSTHLAVHSLRKELTGGGDRVIVHAHPTNLIALTYAMELDTKKLTRLLWGMHSECIMVFPEGCGFVPWELPGSQGLADATTEVMKKRRLALWEFHGAMAVGASLDETFGLVDAADKAAGVYLKVAALGPVERVINTGRLRDMAEFLCLKPDEDILG